MDGACVASFPLIASQVPHVFCFICPTHSLDNFLKNVFSDQETIRVKSVKSGDNTDFDWGTDVFSKPVRDCWEVIKFVTHHSKPLSIFRALAKDPSTWEGNKVPSATELIKYCDTRFASKLLMIQRYVLLRPVLELLVVNPGYKVWASLQKAEVKVSAQETKQTIQSSEHWESCELTEKVLSPVLKILRLIDGKSGASLSKVYHLMAMLSTEYEKCIPGMDETVRENMHALFMARWTYFHQPVFTAAYYLDPQFIKGEGNVDEEADFRTALRALCKIPNCPYAFSDMMIQWASLQTALRVESHGLNPEEAFCEAARKMPSFEWARVYAYAWPAIQFAAGKLSSLGCSASGCEHSWSIEGWIHSKKRNRLGQALVERLVRTHTNILLEDRLDQWRSDVLPWELDMTIEEPDEPDE